MIFLVLEPRCFPSLKTAYFLFRIDVFSELSVFETAFFLCFKCCFLNSESTIFPDFHNLTKTLTATLSHEAWQAMPAYRFGPLARLPSLTSMRTLRSELLIGNLNLRKKLGLNWGFEGLFGPFARLSMGNCFVACIWPWPLFPVFPPISLVQVT